MNRSVVDGSKYYSEKEPAIEIHRKISRETKMAAITLREVCEDSTPEHDYPVLPCGPNSRLLKLENTLVSTGCYLGTSSADISLSYPLARASTREVVPAEQQN